ncbi:putative 4-coumarate--CoA ligase-like 8 [Panicum virgatum]|uniref:putative 4-coumarate--CoA ligase-like 8 n=1 Tax=Panicum virgatum TaxID=38727 RepID=UPI0019D58A80|nr:putative 4-coumarate--CoA ligase-like 8 [Panicum virgatum]
MHRRQKSSFSTGGNNHPVPKDYGRPFQIFLSVGRRSYLATLSFLCLSSLYLILWSVGRAGRRRPPLRGAAAGRAGCRCGARWLPPAAAVGCCCGPCRPLLRGACRGSESGQAGSMAEEALMDELGLHRGHVALLLAPSSLHFPVISLGVLSLGAVLSTANPLLTTGELADQARDSEPFLALTTAELAPKLGSLLPASRVVLVDQLLAGLDGHDAWAGASGTGRDDPTQDAAAAATGCSPGVRVRPSRQHGGGGADGRLPRPRPPRHHDGCGSWDPITDELRELPRPATPYQLFS